MSLRSAHASALLGSELHAQLSSTRALVVGAGGIGCELVKNMVLAGFKDITLLDLDTIDLSNLNRQFLFRKKDVKQPKAIVAARTATSFNPSCRILPIHGNIKEPEFDVAWFQGFTIVLNALDNLDARRHVNRMCMAADVPLIESGTAGYLGQVQPIIRNVTECFDCIPKPVPKSFPVCTIRSTPSTPIHCIVWAKSYLFPQLFGEEEDDTSELDEAAKAGENATEIENLRKEASAFRNVRASMLSAKDEESAALVFNKVFKDDIARLLTMNDMWRFRKPPTPLSRSQILEEEVKVSVTTHGEATESNDKSASQPVQPPSTIKDQRELSLRDNVLLFDHSVQKLSSRLRSGVTLSFDKDDDDALDFVTATSNLRAWAYGIPTLTRWNVKEMAGNIIPAIATTNAVIAGLIVLQAVQVLKAISSSSKPSGGRNVFLQAGRPAVPLASSLAAPPNPRCAVCRETYLHIKCDTSRLTLGDLVEAVLSAEAIETGSLREISVYEGGRILSDPDWDDNLTRTLKDLSCTRGKFIVFADDAEKLGNLCIAISDLPSAHPTEAIPYILPANIVAPPARPPPPPPPSPPSSPVKPLASRTPTKPRPGKRAAPDDDVQLSPSPAGRPIKKRARTAASAHLEADDDIVMLDGPPRATVISAETRALDEEGLVIVDGP